MKIIEMHLMLLTQSSWASVRVLMCLDEMGSNSRTSVCSQATVSTDLSRADTQIRGEQSESEFISLAVLHQLIYSVFSFIHSNLWFNDTVWIKTIDADVHEKINSIIKWHPGQRSSEDQTIPEKRQWNKQSSRRRGEKKAFLKTVSHLNSVQIRCLLSHKRKFFWPEGSFSSQNTT